ncbi:MAG TPA: hypothetical protein VFU20_03960 [Sphingomicrobium sp.]|nr:hypothetical protein [Sphingomicrobium sp.]
MRILMLISAAAAAFAAHAPAAAKPASSQQFKAGTAISLDPAKAYLLVRSPLNLDVKLLREARPDEVEAYKAERSAALEKARSKYARKLAGYERDIKAWNAMSANARAGQVKPERPVEPTDDNLAFKAIESDKFVTLWGGRVFDKPSQARLIAVDPGTYRLYGQMIEGNNGSMLGFCLCMGSVDFDAAPGRITDLGSFRYPLAEALRDKVKPSWNGLTPGKGGLTGMRVEPMRPADPVPASLASLPREAAAYRAAGKIDNFFGVQIDRLTALPGVLSYRRDEVVDERSGGAAAAN